MKKVVIVQNTIMIYRLPIFNLIGQNYDLTIIHSGAPGKFRNSSFNEIIVPIKNIGPFVIHHGLFKAIKSQDPDVVISMFNIRWITIVFWIIYARFSRVVSVVWGHRYSKSWIVNQLRDILMKFSDSILLYGDVEVDHMIKRGVDKTKIFVAPNTLEVKNSEDLSNYPKTSFLYIGRAQVRKKVNKLLEGFASIQDKIPKNINIDIVGSGKENVRLEILAKQLGISSRVNFHGTINDEVILKDKFRDAVAYVSPGPVGLGVIHSFAYGVPVVTHLFEKHGIEFHNLNNQNSIVYNSQDKLGNVLQQLVHDSSLQKDLGKNGFELYQNTRSISKMFIGFQEAIERKKN